MKPSTVSGIIIAVLTASIAYQTIYKPTQQQLAQVQTELTEQAATQELRSQLAASFEQYERLRAQLPSADSTEWLLHQVAKHAEEQGIPLRSIAPKDRTAMGDATKLSVGLQTQGTYHQLGAFVSALERAIPYVWIEEFQIVRNDSTPPQIQLVISTLVVPSLATAPGAAP